MRDRGNGGRISVRRDFCEIQTNGNRPKSKEEERAVQGAKSLVSSKRRRGKRRKGADLDIHSTRSQIVSSSYGDTSSGEDQETGVKRSSFN